MKSRGLRQVDILEKSKPIQEKTGIKMSKAHLSNYVNGRSNPDQLRLVLLSQTLGVSEVWLMGYDVPIEPENNTSLIAEVSKSMKKLTTFNQKEVFNFVEKLLKEQNENLGKNLV